MLDAHTILGLCNRCEPFPTAFVSVLLKRKSCRHWRLLARKALGLSDLKTAILKSAKRMRIINPTQLQINSKDAEKNTLK